MSDFLNSSFSEILQGEITVPSDKSISHRALLLSAVALGATKIFNMLEGSDVLATLQAIKMFGVKVNKHKDGYYIVHGNGLFGLKEPSNTIQCHNAGTLARLILGLLSAQSFKATIIGDKSLSRRPMKRVLKPLEQMGASFNKNTLLNNELTLPITSYGSLNIKAINYELEQPSAQVKSALLLAGLYVGKELTIVENTKTRNHTENMLKYLGVNIVVDEKFGSNIIKLNNKRKDFKAKDFYIPNDFSSAAFFIVAGLIANNSNILLSNININPLRSGLLNTLNKMGAGIKVINKPQGKFIEDVADILVTSSKLKAIEVQEHEIPSMIDEIPILAIAAVFAEGITRIKGIAELKVKESNRVRSIILGLNSLGLKAYEEKNSIIIHGNKGASLNKKVVIDAFSDHRIAMSFLILGLKNKQQTVVKNTKEITTSFPNFVKLANSIGLKIK